MSLVRRPPGRHPFLGLQASLPKGSVAREPGVLAGLWVVALAAHFPGRMSKVIARRDKGEETLAEIGRQLQDQWLDDFEAMSACPIRKTS
jgi:hypothetical protein